MPYLLADYSQEQPILGPLSTFFSFCVTGIRHVFFKLFEKFRRKPGSAIHPATVHFFSRSMHARLQEDYAWRLHPNIIDYRALLWTFNSLDEDGDLQEFFEGLIGLFVTRGRLYQMPYKTSSTRIRGCWQMN